MATTIFVPVAHPSSNTSGNGTYRVFCPVTGGNQGQLAVKFTYIAGASACVVTHASIGIAATPPNTTGITELLFSGASGFTISSAGGSITSDWLTFAGGSGATLLAVHLDFPTSATLYSYNVGEGAGNDSWFLAAVANDYLNNSISGSGYTQQSGIDVLVDQIDTQALAGAVTLMGAICL